MGLKRRIGAGESPMEGDAEADSLSCCHIQRWWSETMKCNDGGLRVFF